MGTKTTNKKTTNQTTHSSGQCVSSKDNLCPLSSLCQPWAPVTDANTRTVAECLTHTLGTRPCTRHGSPRPVPAKESAEQYNP